MCGENCTCSNEFYCIMTNINSYSENMELAIKAFKSKEEAEVFLKNYREEKNKILKKLKEEEKLIVADNYFNYLLEEDFPEVYLEDEGGDDDVISNVLDEFITKTLFPKGYSYFCNYPTQMIIKKYKFGDPILNSFCLG